MRAQVYWQRLRHTQLKAQHQGKPLLLINIDETPIPYHIKPVTGVVKKGFGGQIAVSTNEKRGTASLLATVCNRPSLQHLMPCFLLCNTHRLAVRVRNRLVLPDNFVVWRCKSSWSNGASMMRVVSRINRVCEPYKEFCQPVLLLDTASAHIAPETLRFARACCLEVVIIPAGMTPLLQVADVFVFASVKQRLSQEFQRMRVTQQQVTVRDWIQLLARVPGWLQEKSWTEAFAATTGLEGGCLTNHLEALQISHITNRARPTFQQLCLVWPRTRFGMQHYQALFGGRYVEHAVRVE